MGTLIQVRDVPDEVHRTLKARAARQGVSLSEYLRTELQRVAESPTPEELLARLRSRKAVRTTESSASALRAARDDPA
jgi:plasmid stability protein